MFCYLPRILHPFSIEMIMKPLPPFFAKFVLKIDKIIFDTKTTINKSTFLPRNYSCIHVNFRSILDNKRRFTLPPHASSQFAEHSHKVLNLRT